MRFKGLTASLLMVAFLALRAGAQATEATSSTAPAAATAPVGAAVTLTIAMEEGKKTIEAKVTLVGKPVEGATVGFLVKRTFGNMEIGTDKTLDDGTAAVAFPTDLPGGATGTLHVMVEVRTPTSVAGARAEGDFPGGLAVAASPQGFPRALWAPQAPWPLILVIIALLAGAWGSYAYVVLQLLAIKKGATK